MITNCYLYDSYHKNIIYVHKDYIEYTEVIHINKLTLKDILNSYIDIDKVDKEDGHYSQWIIIHPKPSSPITESILIGSYYRSPNRTITKPDIKALQYILNHILKAYRQQKWMSNQLMKTNM